MSSPVPSSPHDAVFRRILGEPANAASQLRATLPAALVERLDLDRLTLAPGSFIDDNLRWRYSDLLFTAPLSGRKAFIYILIEHQSSTDPVMAFRMLRYIVRIWDRHMDEHPKTTRLPAVIPLVVHHNQRPWNSPTQMLDLLDLDPGLTDAWQDYLPRFQYVLDDLTRLDQQALRDRPVTPAVRVTLLTLKIAPGNPEIATDLQPWAPDLRAILDRPGGQKHFAAILSYIESVGEATTDELRTLVATLGPDAEEAYMTTAEMLRAEGRVEGRAEGRVEGRAEALIQLLARKFGQLPQPLIETIRAASTDQLEAWTDRVLTAKTLDQVFS